MWGDFIGVFLGEELRKWSGSSNLNDLSIMVNTSLLTSFDFPSRIFPFNETGLELLRFVRNTLENETQSKVNPYITFYLISKCKQSLQCAWNIFLSLIKQSNVREIFFFIKIYYSHPPVKINLLDHFQQSPYSVPLKH